MNKDQYFLGAQEKERLRLEAQALLWEPITIRVLTATGLAPGMSVLDIGTGAGDVALLASKIVGPSGRVLGIDLNEDMTSHAQQRAEKAGIPQANFQSGALQPGQSHGQFDLVVGRLVTGFQADKPAFLRTAASYVKPGGTLAILEAAWDMCNVWSSPPLPAYNKIVAEIVRLIAAMGFDPGLGSHLYSTFQEAGLAAPALTADILIGGSNSYVPTYNMEVLETILPSARARNIETLDQPTFEALRAEAKATAAREQTQFQGACVVGAWTIVD